jgi:hypothetical protein
MSILEQTAVDTITMPINSNDRTFAARDPLSSPDLLSRLYFDDFDEVRRPNSYLYNLSDLARNPSLSPDVFSALFVKLMEYESLIPSQDSKLYALSCLFLNPLVTFEQVLSIVIRANEIQQNVSSEKIKTCKTVIEIFDNLIIFAKESDRGFFSNLLRSPMVTSKEFTLRVRNIELKEKLAYALLCSDPRFVPNASDYFFALSFINNTDSSSFGHASAITANPHANPVFLAKIVGAAGGYSKARELAYANLNCPFELSAVFHVDNMENYKWRPSYLLGLEAKVNEHLTLISGEGPWEDLPLSWKLKIIAE